GSKLGRERRGVPGVDERRDASEVFRSRGRIAAEDEICRLGTGKTVLESDVDSVADFGRSEPIDAGDEPARLGRPQAGQALSVEAIRAAPEQGKGAVGEAANPEGGRLGNRGKRRELRGGTRYGAL